MDPTPRPGAVDIDALYAQKRDLTVEAAREPTQFPVAAHHPVTRDDDGERIGSHGLTDRSGSARIPELVGDIAVRDDATVRDVHKSFEDASLKGRGT